jgi:hypothetical protein
MCEIKHSSFVIQTFVISIGECRIRTCEGISHQIYSLTRLTASVTPRVMNNSVSSRHAEDRRAATHWSQQTVDIAIDD